MGRQARPVTDRELKAWLAAGEVDRGVGEGLTFIASAAGARDGKASWVLRYRLHGRGKEKVLGRYPELSLKQARELARQDRLKVDQGIDVAAAKQADKALFLEAPILPHLNLFNRTYEDVTPIAQLNADPAALVVRSDSPINSLEDLMTVARKEPGKMNMGTSGSRALARPATQEAADCD